AGRLWWLCPLHPDRNPSFCISPGRSEWRCFGCGARGDAADLLMRVRGITFAQAREALTARAGGIASPSRWPIDHPGPRAATRAEAPKAAPKPPPGLSLAEALALVADAEQRLWAPDGAAYRACLLRRGLTEPTIRAARLGWTPGVRVAKQRGGGCFPAAGIVIPWFEGVRLTMIKIRQPEGRQPKYVEAFRDGPRLYPAPSVVRPGMPLIVTEGEFDALLLAQELEGSAAVVTLGSASARLDPAILWLLAGSGPIFTAHDADEAGDRAAAGWPARAQRVRPPGPDKDWTEAARSGVNLARWWHDRLGGIERPVRSTWEELARRRWGSGPEDETPGIVIDGPRPPRSLAASGVADSLDPYARVERAAIMEFDGGLAREDAERAAGLSTRGNSS
ncbi:MAG TPA: CHC2 zinc finger domain-containing protein, partial [Isosphaeraceae bacterium]|nr:CHC2 zinc finger domain-containing protein [Isosphaeraceae bacterium]